MCSRQDTARQSTQSDLRHAATSVPRPPTGSVRGMTTGPDRDRPCIPSSKPGTISPSRAEGGGRLLRGVREAAGRGLHRGSAPLPRPRRAWRAVGAHCVPAGAGQGDGAGQTDQQTHLSVRGPGKTEYVWGGDHGHQSGRGSWAGTRTLRGRPSSLREVASGLALLSYLPGLCAGGLSPLWSWWCPLGLLSATPGAQGQPRSSADRRSGGAPAPICVGLSGGSGEWDGRAGFGLCLPRY